MPTGQEDEEELERAGFTGEQVACLLNVFATHGHTHEIEDVIGLDEELDEIAEE